MHLFYTLFIILQKFSVSAYCIQIMDITHYINIFQACVVEIIDNVVLPNKVHYQINTSVEFPVIRSLHIYNESIYSNIGLKKKGKKPFRIFCDRKEANLITPKAYRYKRTKPMIKNTFANCEATFYITPLKSCQKWSRKDISQRFPGILQNNKNLSAVARSGLYYLIVGNTVTRNQVIKDNIFYDIDIPQLKLSAPRSVGLYTKFYIEMKTSDVSFYLVKMENAGLSVERVNKNCSITENSKGISKLFDSMCFYKTFVGSEYIFYKIGLKKIYFHHLRMQVVRQHEQNYQQLYWVLRCPHCNFQVSGTHKSKTNYQIIDWKGHPAIELIIIHSMFKNSTVLTDTLYTHDKLPLPQLQIEQNINRMQFVRIENKGFHFVTCANTLRVSGLSFKGLISAFDLLTWIGFLIMSVYSMLVLIHLLKHSSSNYEIFDVCSFTVKVILEHNIPNFPRNTCFVTGAWFLVGVVISQCYRGDNVTHLTAPFQKPKLDYYSQLLDGNFSFLSHMSFQSQMKEEEFTLNLITGLAPLVKSTKPTNGSTILNQMFGSEFEMAYVNSVTSENLELVKKIHANLNRPEEMKNRSQALDVDTNLFVDILQMCGRQAYIGNYVNAFSIFNQVRGKLQANKSDYKDSLSLSKETLASTVTSWRFERIPVDPDQFTINIHCFLQSGIMDLWQKWNLRIQTYNDTVITAKSNNYPVKSLSMHGNILVIFCLWMSLLSMDCIVFGKEILIFYIMKTWRKRHKMKESTGIVRIEVISSMSDGLQI